MKLKILAASLLFVAQIQLSPVTVGRAFAQGSPIPGAYSALAEKSSAPLPGVQKTQPVLPKAGYRSLPLTAEDAKIRLDELRGALATGRPQDSQEGIFEICEWLADAADAHYRMFQAFGKSELTKSQAQAEKQLNQKFSQLKREAQLLKADLLIKQMRAPEALQPLVEIVTADPRSATGQAAYKRLIDLGFSQEAAEPQVQAQSPKQVLK